MPPVGPRSSAPLTHSVLGTTPSAATATSAATRLPLLSSSSRPGLVAPGIVFEPGSAPARTERTELCASMTRRPAAASPRALLSKLSRARTQLGPAAWPGWESAACGVWELRFEQSLTKEIDCSPAAFSRGAATAACPTASHVLAAAVSPLAPNRAASFGLETSAPFSGRTWLAAALRLARRMSSRKSAASMSKKASAMCACLTIHVMSKVCRACLHREQNQREIRSDSHASTDSTNRCIPRLPAGGGAHSTKHQTHAQRTQAPRRCRRCR